MSTKKHQPRDNVRGWRYACTCGLKYGSKDARDEHVARRDAQGQAK